LPEIPKMTEPQSRKLSLKDKKKQEEINAVLREIEKEERAANFLFKLQHDFNSN